jgi:hypothetical protein
MLLWRAQIAIGKYMMEKYLDKALKRETLGPSRMRMMTKNDWDE